MTHIPPRPKTMDESPYLNLWWNGKIDLPHDKLIAWAQTQRLLPLIGWRAKQRGWALPTPLQDAVRLARYQASARQLLAERQLHELAEIARLQQLPVVIVKGQVVAEVYPSATLRIYNDIDLLAPPSAVPALTQALRRHGYTAPLTGGRAFHLPPFNPPEAGLCLEVHTAMKKGGAGDAFTFAQWADGLRPWASFPGLLVPDPVGHWLYLVSHALEHHECEMGLLPLADLKFWTDIWTAQEWESLATLAKAGGWEQLVGLALALVTWFWQDPWPSEIASRFPEPPEDILRWAQAVTSGEVETESRLPNLWRDLPERSVRGWLAYAQLVLLGDPVTRRNLPWHKRLLYHLRRPAYLVRNHGPALWQLLRGQRKSRETWAAQRKLASWLRSSG